MHAMLPLFPLVLYVYYSFYSIYPTPVIKLCRASVKVLITVLTPAGVGNHTVRPQNSKVFPLVFVSVNAARRH